jgi:cytochrome c-type biogenesis protein CcsB
MPLDTFAKGLAVKLTGRSHWSQKRGSEAFAGKHRIELLCDLLFKPQVVRTQELITIENRPLKKALNLDEKRKFFSFDELAQNVQLQTIISEYFQGQRENPDAKPTDQQKKALEISSSLDVIAGFMNGRRLAIVPHAGDETFMEVGALSAAPGAFTVLDEFQAFGQAYAAGEPLDDLAVALRKAIDEVAMPSEKTARAVGYEVFYNNHNPWLWTAVLYGLAIVVIGLSAVCFRRTLFALGLVLVVWGTAEQVLGLGLRVTILGRAPVSNTYEALIWMGLVAIIVGSVAQVINRKGWYIFAATVAAELSVLFAMLVPLHDQTNALPAVLRSNYWLIIHVLTIVASYGVLMLAAVIAHAYLLKQVLFRKSAEPTTGRSHPLVVQTYRAIQIGVLLLTVGTILGGVWAADSWGRFWGWDPKETWALISIVVYFIMLHARHVGWLRDFGLAVAAIVGFMAIVWTFYGVNYVMAAGLHSYGFGAGGEKWVGMWAIAEFAFLGLCKWRQMSLLRSSPTAITETMTTPENAPPKSPPASSPA